MTKRSNARTNLLLQNNIFAVQIRVFLSECIIAVVLLSIAAAIISTQNDPAVLVFPCSVLVLYSTAFFGGLIGAKLWESFLAVGLLSGTVLFLLTTVLSFLPLQVPGSGLSAALAVCMRLLIIAISVLGAWIGQKRDKHSKKHKKHRH